MGVCRNSWPQALPLSLPVRMVEIPTLINCDYDCWYCYDDRRSHQNYVFRPQFLISSAAGVAMDTFFN